MKNRRFLIFTGALCALLLTAGLLAVRGHRVVPLPEPHPEDFSPHISPTELAALGGDPEIKKVWYLSQENWFLSTELEDLSQVITGQPLYCVPNARGYTLCSFGADGAPTRGTAAEPDTSAPVPHGLWGLTYARIEADLSGIAYQDYIITQSTTFETVIVWARCPSGDRFLTYPSRSDLTGIGVGDVYTLPELKAALASAADTAGGH